MAATAGSWRQPQRVAASTAELNLHAVMAQGDEIVSFERIVGGVGVGVANAPVTTTLHLPPGKDPARRLVQQPMLTFDCALERAETPPSPSSTVPFLHDPDYVDRPSLRHDISTRLSVPGARIALVGLGGSGKTQLAVEHVRHVRVQSPQTWVLWLHAGTAARFEQSVRDNAEQTKIHGRHDPKANIFQCFRNWLCAAKKGRWVMVLDNVDDANFLLATPASAEDGQQRRLIDYLPACEHGSVLITSRSKSEAQRLVHSRQTIEVPPMKMTHAKALLEKKLGAQAGPGYEKLAAALDYLPLAMAQAAAYISVSWPRWSVEQYLDELERSSRSRTSLLRRDEQFPDRNQNSASSSILVTWQISFEAIVKIRPSAADLLSIMSFCDRQAIPETLMRDARSSSDCGDNGLAVDEFEGDVAMLRSFSFISATANRSSWEMHRLVQDATRMWLEDRDELTKYQDCFLHRLNQAFPFGRYENWSRCQVLLPHAQIAAGYKTLRGESVLAWATVMYNAAWYTFLNGQLAVAETMAVASMQATTSALGVNDEHAIYSAAILGNVLRGRGRWKEAEQLEVKVLERIQATIGPDHPNALNSMANLAATYWNQGRWKEAEQLEVKVLERRQATQGLDHLDTLNSMGNLATTYSSQGRWKEAEQLEVKVLERRQATLGLDHPDTLSGMANLASTYRNQGRWKEAEQLEVRVLERRQATLGLDHPDTLSSMGNLASTYGTQGRWKEAEQLEVKVLERRQATLGLDHPDTLKGMGNLASTYRNQGRWKEAEQLEVKVLERSQATLGLDHPDTLKGMANLASTYDTQGRWKEAEQLLNQVVKGRIEKLGKEHPYSISAIAALEKMRHEAEALSGGEDISDVRKDAVRMSAHKRAVRTISRLRLSDEREGVQKSRKWWHMLGKLK